MVETYHEDLEQHYHEIYGGYSRAIILLQDLMLHAEDYAASPDIAAIIKNVPAHDSATCQVCIHYLGNPTPPPPEPARDSAP